MQPLLTLPNSYTKGTLNTKCSAADVELWSQPSFMDTHISTLARPGSEHALS